RLIIAATIVSGAAFAQHAQLSGAAAGSTFRAIALGSAASGMHIEVDIDPASEAAVSVLEDNGLDNYTDARVQGVITTVEAANGDTDFAGLSAADAVQRAQVIALGSGSVQARLVCGGDCNLDGPVTINELIAAVNAALRNSLDACM